MMNRFVKQQLSCILLTYLILTTACNNKQPDTTNRQCIIADNISLIGKRIQMPDSMEAYVALKDSLFMDSSQLARQPSFRIYAFINVSCASCIPEVDTWNIEAHDFIKYRVPIILICTTKDNFEYIKYLFENRKLKKFPYPLYLDIKNLFYKQNSFINRDLTKQAVLVDNNNTIVASGNPIDSDEIKSMYINKIKSK